MRQLSHLRAICFLVTILFLLVGSLSAEKKQPGLVLENDYIRLEFESENFGLSTMVDKVSGVNHVQPTTRPHLLWEVAFRRGVQEALLTNVSVTCTGSRIENLSNGSQKAIIEWNSLDWWREKKAVSVQVTIELPKESGIALWRISVDNESNYWGVWTVKFPYVSGFMKPGDYDIAVPYSNSGLLYSKSDTTTRSGNYPSGRWPSQFLCASKGTNSVYLAALDPGARKKEYFITPGGNNYFLQYAEDMGVPGSDYGDYFPVAFGAYQGNWVDACKQYRLWALTQRWTEMGPVSQRTDMPDLIKNVGLWWQTGWEFGKSQGDMPHDMNLPMLEANKFLDVPTALHWYNWHHMRFDNEYPHFLPPKPGFRERVAELVKSGMLIMPYINGLIVDMDNLDFREFYPYTVKDEAGIQRMHVYGTGSGRMVPMCASQPFWHKTIAGLVDSLTGYYGCNGVYIDQIAAHMHELCFDKSHGHPLGGGRWWVDGYQELLSKVREISIPRKVVITSENTAEPYMNKLDAFLTWYEPMQEDIPMLQTVYSGYTFYFGGKSASSPRTTDRGFIMGQGRFFITGQQNGWMSLWFMTPEHKVKADYFKKIGKYRIATKKFLSYGELMDMIEPTNNVSTVTEFWEDHFRNPRSGTLPSTMGSVWRSEDGHLGIFLVNFLNEKNTFQYSIKPQKYGITPPRTMRFQIDSITPEGIVPVGRSIAPVLERTEYLEPYEIKVLDISPSL